MTAAAVGAPAARRAVGIVAALRIGFQSMWQQPLLAVGFLTATLIQGTLQGLLIWSLRKVLLSLSAPTASGALPIAAGAMLIFGVWLLRAASAFLAENLAVRVSHRVEIDSMLKVLDKVLRLSVRFLDRNSRGDIILAAYHDLKGIRTVTLEVGRIVLYASQLAGLLAAAWLMSPKLALLGIITVPLGAIPAYWLGREITRSAGKERTSIITLHDSFLQVSAGMRAIKVNRAQARMLARARTIGHDLQAHLFRQARDKGLARLALETISGIGLILVLTIGGHDVVRGAMPWQGLLGLLIAIMAVYSPVVGLLALYNSIRGALPSLDRVDAIMREPIDVEDRPGARRLPREPDLIELRGVSFAYGGRLVLDDISLTIRRGETIGIVGPSGAGKSTLLSLLLRFYDPTAGAVLFDGVDLRDLAHADLMDLSSIVLQEPFLFQDTVANNIRLGRPAATMDEVVAAARAANVHDEIMAMEQGYDTILGVGKDARGVSGGQKQRICIASALLKNAPLLFLDEATSSLDSFSEHAVQGAIERLMEGRTTFVIAHRLSTLRRADRIVVLDDGGVVGVGPHDQLRESCATYQRLWHYQHLQGEADMVGAVVERN